MAYFPVMLELEGCPCLVVGGGRIASRKVSDLLVCSAGITVISPVATPDIMTLAEESKIKYLPRSFHDGDAIGYRVVIAATDDQDLNRRVSAEARSQGSLVNVVDCAPESNFIVPAVVRRGDLVLAVSTGGASPAFARQLKERLEREFGPEYALLLVLMKRLRPVVIGHFPAGPIREEIFHRLAGSGLIQHLAARDKQRILEELEGILGTLVVESSVEEIVNEVLSTPIDGIEVSYGNY